ncbi:MAG: PEP-CTERM sorting domain-containing protein [Scytonema sp. RU_4_4]|nr:PEP-CTERM sorting domain-containing protein [Scytonema sp. RU_4_4]
MTLLKKLSMAAVTTATAFLALGTFVTDAAQAALFKYSFSSEGANGYFVYDTDTAPNPQYAETPNSDVYNGAVVDYKVDLGDYGVYEGNTGDAIVYLLRSEVNPDIPPEYDSDVFEFLIPSSEAGQSIIVDFYYEKGAFGESTELLTSVPSSGALIDVKPFSTDATDRDARGESVYQGNATTRIEKIPEPTSSVALLGAGALFILRRRQRQKTQLKMTTQTCSN